MSYLLHAPKFPACFSFDPPCLLLLTPGLILSSGGMLSALPACLFAWPVFFHCQHLLDSNSKHGIPLGSPFLPVPRDHAFQMEHKCASPAGSPLLILPGNDGEQDVAASSHVAEVCGVEFLLPLRTMYAFC